MELPLLRKSCIIQPYRVGCHGLGCFGVLLSFRPRAATGVWRVHDMNLDTAVMKTNNGDGLGQIYLLQK